MTVRGATLSVGIGLLAALLLAVLFADTVDPMSDCRPRPKSQQPVCAKNPPADCQLVGRPSCR